MSKVLDFMEYIEAQMDKNLPHVLYCYMGEQERQGQTYVIYRLDYMTRNWFRFQQNRARVGIEYFRKLIGPHLFEERGGFVVLQIPVR